jgi:hypothetical protein
VGHLCFCDGSVAFVAEALHLLRQSRRNPVGAPEFIRGEERFSAPEKAAREKDAH